MRLDRGGMRSSEDGAVRFDADGRRDGSETRDVTADFAV
jgi:hypothetical protein